MGAIGAIRKKNLKKKLSRLSSLSRSAPLGAERDRRDRRAGELTIGAPIFSAYRAEHIPRLSYPLKITYNR